MAGLPNVARVRASYAKILLGRVDATDLKAQVRARMTAGALKRIEDTPGLAYLDGEAYEELLEASFIELGDDALVEAVRSQTRIFRESPLMAGTIRALLGLLGSSPHALLRHLPRLRDATVQGFGALSYANLGPGKAGFALRGYPPVHMTPANMALFRGTFLGAFDIVGAVGTVTTSSVRNDAGEAEFALAWPLGR